MKKQATQLKRPARIAKKASRVPSPPKSSKPLRPPVPIVPSSPAQEKSLYWHKYHWFVIGFFGSVAVFAFCAWLVHEHLLFGKDYSLFRFFNDWPESLRIGFLVLTTLGSFWAAAVVVATAFVFRLYQLAWRLALSVFTVYGLLIVLKEIFARARPEAMIGDIHVRVLEASFAFPSAHTAVATVLALSLRTYLPLPTIWQWIIVFAWIVGVGLSRVYLGVHTPLDIAGGFVLGVGVVCFWRIVPTPLKRVLHLK